MNKSIFLSVIVPVYNESKRLNKLAQVISYLNSLKINYELIVINDGSTDSTLKQLKDLQQKNNFQIISYSKNKGKGYAIKKGMLAAGGENRLFLDIDLSTPMEEWEKFIPFIGKYEIIIASRKTKGSKLITHQPWLRENLGKGFTYLSKIALGVKVSDFTCGFKCFSAKAAEKIFNRMTINRWGFDSESLFLAQKMNLSVKEAPVVWNNDKQTKVKFPQDLIRSLADIAVIRLNDLRGKYQ